MDFKKVDNLITKAISGQNQRSARIITKRYGLDSKSASTLAELGKEYNLTRERVRQIQAVIVKSIKEEVLRHGETMKFLKFVHNYLDKMNGLRSSKMLVKDFMEMEKSEYEEEIFSNRLHFLAELAGEPNVLYEDNDWHGIWHNDKQAYDKAQSLVDDLLKHQEHDFNAFLNEAMKKHGLSEKTIVNYLHASKKFGTGPYGELGAKHWIHINPKTARDKNYLVLKKAGRPLHFREIAELVNKLDGVKKSHPDTIHNELIKDDRFVLVGRGMYALK